jgi:hypothetical protein
MEEAYTELRPVLVQYNFKSFISVLSYYNFCEKKVRVG